MKRLTLIAMFFWSCEAYLFAQAGAPASYYFNDFNPAPSVALKYGLFGFDNPATLTMAHQPDLMVAWSDGNNIQGYGKRWGAFLTMPNVGFGAIQNNTPAGTVTDYAVSAAAGPQSMSFGAGYHWSTGETAFFQRANQFSLGMAVRPFDYLSVGATAIGFGTVNNAQYVFEGAARPFGNELVTLFADYTLRKTKIPNEPQWSAGAIAEPLSGIRVIGRYFEYKAATLGLQVSLGAIGFSSATNLDANQKIGYTTYAVRIGAYDRNIIRPYFERESEMLALNLGGSIGYQRYQWFDNSKTLLELLQYIEAAKTDPAVAGIVINTSNMAADREKLWEIREKLKKFRQTGKHVIMFIDRAGLDLYHFASVADKIVLDPLGTITTEGYVMGRTFLKGTLEKVGLAYDEWRFFKYKSANEVLVNDKMSPADKEQRQHLVDANYAQAKKDICESRGLTPQQFDDMVDNKFIFLPQEAIDSKLVDTLARALDISEIVAKLEGEKKNLVGPGAMDAFRLPSDDRWGAKPEIAVIYALGACAMDAGINARSLVRLVRGAVKDTKVKAIVLRVDSPGGDALASDFIAEALKEAKGKKPVIVSQGYVAGSGGYWLSMYADTIVAAPTTITGSIGVIGGWMYNKGLKELLGMSVDFVKAGGHADLGYGFTLPFIGLGVPDRNLTPEERQVMERSIKTYYREFVAKVASGRKKTIAEIDSIAQGHVYPGTEGKEIGLVDVLGGLETAIRIAKERAGIPPEQEVALIEVPKPGLLDLGMFVPKIFGVDAPVAKNEILEQLKFRLEHNGEAMPILPLDDCGYQYK